MDARRYVSVQEFVQLSGLSLATIHRYLKRGILRHLQPGGRHSRILIPSDALEMDTPSAAEPKRSASTAPPAPAVNTQPLDDETRLPGPRPQWKRQACPAAAQEV
jgi:hypothetical protein